MPELTLGKQAGAFEPSLSTGCGLGTHSGVAVVA